MFNMSYLIWLPLHLKFSQHLNHPLTFLSPYIREKKNHPSTHLPLKGRKLRIKNKLRAIKNKYPTFKRQKDPYSIPGFFQLLAV